MMAAQAAERSGDAEVAASYYEKAIKQEPHEEKAYRRLMNQNHPDKLHAKGLPESMMKMAEEKTRQIRAAYEVLRDARGMK